MKKLFYALAFILIAISVFFNVSAYAAGGAGGSWGDDSGFGGNGGSTGGGGSGGSWEPNICTYRADGKEFSNGTSACQHYSTAGNHKGFISFDSSNDICSYYNGSNNSVTIRVSKTCSLNPEPEPEPCSSGTVRNSSGQCVPELKCPAGYVKSGSTCIWQCPAGFKMLGGNCVKDDAPEDCDPTIQTCDDNGEPTCDPCSKLQQLINNNLTMINNDNRVISLTENIVTSLNTTNNNINNVNTSINNVNNNINNVNNNLTTINESIENVITTIENNKPDFDTSGIEAKLQQLIDKNTTVDGADIEIDFTELLLKLDEIEQAIIDNKYDDTELKAKIDELINKDLSEITDRQDEQTGLLEDIKRLLMPVNQAELAPSLENEPFDAHLDPWSAIRGFDINQNMVNAQAQCPSGAAYSFTVLGETFDMPINILCGFLGQIGVGIMFLAYMSGAFIIVKGD